MSKWLRRFCVVIALAVIGVGGAAFWLSDKYVVPIMMYHRVNTQLLPYTVTVSPQSFSRHMEFLKKNNYRVISLDELAQGIRQGKIFPKKTVVVTFDDGYEDNYTAAFPILKKHGFPAIFFVPPGQIDTPNHLTWPQLRNMLEEGHLIGSHTYQETYLPSLALGEQKKDIKDSKELLEEQLGARVDYFSYPVGGFSEEIKIFVKEAGYRAACATNRGNDRFNKDLYELKRIRFGDADNSDIILWVKLSGYYNLFRKLKSPH